MLKDVDNVVAAQLNNVEITFEATSNAEKANTKVVIVIVPLHFGDQFVQPILEIVKTSVKSNHISYQHITASSLLRFLRRINDGDPAKGVSEAEVKIEKAIALTKLKIIALYSKFIISIAWEIFIY